MRNIDHDFHVEIDLPQIYFPLLTCYDAKTKDRIKFNLTSDDHQSSSEVCLIIYLVEE